MRVIKSPSEANSNVCKTYNEKWWFKILKTCVSKFGKSELYEVLRGCIKFYECGVGTLCT